VPKAKGLLKIHRDKAELRCRQISMMLTKLSQISPAVIILLICSVLSGCGITGRTSRFALKLDLPTSKVAANVHVASVVMEPNAAYLNAFKVYRWGKFGSDDLRNIEQSLQATITAHIVPASRSTDSRMDIHVVVRRYIVSTSNTGVAVLACVAWAATTPKGELIYEEQFYASDSGVLFGTIGLMKDSVHKAIVRRIVTTALVIVGDGATGIQPRQFENTSTSFEEAVSRLPGKMVSLGNPPFMPLSPLESAIGVLTPSGVSMVNWGVATPPKAIDWTGHLAKLYGP